LWTSDYSASSSECFVHVTSTCCYVMMTSLGRYALIGQPSHVVTPLSPPPSTCKRLRLAVFVPRIAASLDYNVRVYFVEDTVSALQVGVVIRLKIWRYRKFVELKHKILDVKHIQLQSLQLHGASISSRVGFYAPAPMGCAIKRWCPSSVRLSVPRLTLSREWKGVASWILAGRKPMIRVTRDLIRGRRVKDQGHKVMSSDYMHVCP